MSIEPKAEFTPSKYQSAIYSWVEAGSGSAVVEACAGSGKTTVLIESISRMNGRVLFCAFSKEIALELGRRVLDRGILANVSTVHSLGFSAIRRGMGQVRVDGNKLSRIAWDVAKTLEIEDEDLEAAVAVTAAKVADLTRLTLADHNDPDAIRSVIDRYGIDVDGELEESVIGAVPIILNLDAADRSVIDFGDMIWLPHVLKLLPDRYDWICWDEVQDANAAQRELVLKASRDGGRVLAVGDPHQCQPPETKVLVSTPGNRWRPASTREVAISDLKVGDKVMSFDRRSASFVREARVNAVGKRNYKGDLIAFSAGRKAVRSTPNHKWLARWSTRRKDLWVTYVMRKGVSFRVGMCQLFSSGGNFHPLIRCKYEDADALWILKVHEDKGAASANETLVSCRYGLPMTTFLEVCGSVHMKQSQIDSVFLSLGDLTSKAKTCLSDHGRDLAYPFCTNGRGQRKGRATIFEVHACNLDAWMAVPVLTDHAGDVHGCREWASIESLRREPFDGQVYSLDIDRHHKYIANGIVTCNSIFGWAGADTSSMETLRARLNATVLPLSICYRCPASHVELAKQIVPQIEARPNAPQGTIIYETLEKAIPAMTAGDMVICRTNAPLAKIAMQLVRMGRKVVIRGRDISSNLSVLVKRQKAGQDVQKLIEKLQRYGAREAAKLTAAGKEVQAEAILDKVDTIVALCDGIETVAAVLDRIVRIFSDDVAGIVLSSVHRAKGLEANRVFVYRPELMPHPRARQGWEMECEQNLRYVSLTRAKSELWFVSER